MNRFERTAIAPSAVSPEALGNDPEVLQEPHYAAYTDLDTGVTDYPATTTIAALDRTLGSRLTRFLLQTDAEATLHASAVILHDHATTNEPTKDLQANLLINSVKEIVQTEPAPLAEHRRLSEDLLRRCSLEPDFKAKVTKTLMEDNALASSQLAITRHE